MLTIKNDTALLRELRHRALNLMCIGYTVIGTEGVRSDIGDGTGLQDKTLCPDYLSSIGNHYNTHNLYGPGQAEPTLM